MSGGKTIINALGISNGCYLQDYNLVEQQNQGNFTPEQKVELLINRLKAENRQWKDLQLGDGQLYNGNYTSNRFKQLQGLKNYFFIVAGDAGPASPGLNNIEKFEKLTRAAPDFTCITLVNTNRFINFRLGFNDLDFDRSQYPELSQQWPGQIEDYFKQKADVVWDCDWFFDRGQFLSNLKNIYKMLGLTDFNEYLISKYYDEYITTLKRIVIEINNIPKEINDNSTIQLHSP